MTGFKRGGEVSTSCPTSQQMSRIYFWDFRTSVMKVPLRVALSPVVDKVLRRSTGQGGICHRSAHQDCSHIGEALVTCIIHSELQLRAYYEYSVQACQMILEDVSKEVISTDCEGKSTRLYSDQGLYRRNEGASSNQCDRMYSGAGEVRMCSHAICPSMYKVYCKRLVPFPRFPFVISMWPTLELPSGKYLITTS